MNDNITDNLSLNQQQYLETIFSLCYLNDHAHVKEIADRLGISMPSVTEALQSLAKLKLINYTPRQAVTITEYGKKIGRELHDRHKVFADFFHNILGLELEYSEEMACNIEHVIDAELRKRLADFILYMNDELDVSGSSLINEFKARYTQVD